MAKIQKSNETAGAKSEQYVVSKGSEARTVSPKPTSKSPKVAGSVTFSAKNSIGQNTVAGIVYQDSDKRSTSIIAEKAGRPEWQMTAVDKMNIVRKGISKKKLENLKSKTRLDYEKLSTILSTTRATLINKKGTEHFSAALSERIVSIADLYSYGFEVFEDEDKFNEWIFRPNQALGGRPPFEFLDNQYGREEIKNLIGRIGYGVYS